MKIVPSDGLKIYTVPSNTLMCCVRFTKKSPVTLRRNRIVSRRCHHGTPSPGPHMLKGAPGLPPGPSSRTGQWLPSWLQQWDPVGLGLPAPFTPFRPRCLGHSSVPSEQSFLMCNMGLRRVSSSWASPSDRVTVCL